MNAFPYMIEEAVAENTMGMKYRVVKKDGSCIGPWAVCPHKRAKEAWKAYKKMRKEGKTHP